MEPSLAPSASTLAVVTSSSMRVPHRVPPRTMKEGKRFVRPEDRARIDTTLRGVKRLGGAWHAEYRVVHRPNESCSAETRWVAFDGSVARGRRGTAPSLFGTVRDITQRERSKSWLRATCSSPWLERLPSLAAMRMMPKQNGWKSQKALRQFMACRRERPKRRARNG